MQAITTSYDQLAHAINQGFSITVTKEGNWNKRHWLTALFRRFVGWQESDKLNSARQIVKHVEKLSGRTQTETVSGLVRPENHEQLDKLLTSVTQSISSIADKDTYAILALKEVKKNQPDDIHRRQISSKIKAAYARSAALKIKSDITGIKVAHTYLATNQQNIVGLGRNQQTEEAYHNHLNWLQEKAKKYLKNHKLDQARPESYDDIENKLKRAALYPKFVEAVKTDAILRQLFFKSLLFNSPHGSTAYVDTFIQAPYIHKLLRKSFLDKRLQAVANNGIQFIENTQTRRKEVKLLIHGRYQDITDLTHKVETAYGVVETVHNVFKEFQQLNYRNIDIEYFQSGVERYDAQLRKFDFTQESWWENLPNPEVRTAEWIKNHFKITELDNTKPFLVLRATRTTKDYNPQNTHGFVEIYLPQPDGNFAILSPGKYAESFPRTTTEVLQFIFSTARGVYSLIDMNKFITHRDHCQVKLPALTDAEFAAAMNFFKEQFIKAREGRLNFQMQGHNCTTSVQTLLNTVYPTLDFKPFRTHALELNVPQPMKWMTQARRIFPTDASWNIFRRSISFIFGAWKGRSYVENNSKLTARLMNNELWKTGFHELPARLFNTKETLIQHIQNRA